MEGFGLGCRARAVLGDTAVGDVGHDGESMYLFVHVTGCGIICFRGGRGMVLSAGVSILRRGRWLAMGVACGPVFRPRLRYPVVEFAGHNLCCFVTR